MTSSIVIFASLVLAAAFILAWFLRPGLRQEIERPKHMFQDDLRRFDQHCKSDREAAEAKRK